MVKDTKFTVGLVQMGMSSDPAANLDKALQKVAEAAQKGAQVVCLPELYRSPYFCQRESGTNKATMAKTIAPSTDTPWRIA